MHLKDVRLEDVKLDCIVVGDRIDRNLSEETIAGLMESMKEIGLIFPVMITRPRMQPVLISGAHRLEAARRLGWDSIKCLVVPNIEDDSAKLVEIDENLVRRDLTLARRGVYTALRKEIYLRQHPETKRGTAGAIAANKKKGRKSQLTTCDHTPEAEDPTPAFIDDTAKKTGKHRATIARDSQRAASIPHLADCFDTSLDKGDELDALGKMTPEQQAETIEEAKSGKQVSAKAKLKKIKREAKEQALAETTARIADNIGHQVYNVILADPPWRFEPYSRETGMDRAADNHYPTADLERIKDLDVDGAAADDCVLFLWATAPMLPQALEVMDAWGFSYRTHIVWGKDRIGTGYWARNKHELLLIGVRGEIPAPAPGTQPDSLIMAPVGSRRHSEKPEAFHQVIERMFPTVPRLEMFSRTEREGWDSWGNEAEEVAA